MLRVRGGGRFPFVSFDDASHVRVGDWVVAVGNPFGLDGTATAGIVSAIGRRDAGATYVDFLQIDAPINRGNSGGPTFDLAGSVIGVNSQILSPTGGSVGIGFAIPSRHRQHRSCNNCCATAASPAAGSAFRSRRSTKTSPAAWASTKPRGALVGSLVPDGPAARAGIQQGDVILTYNGQRIEDSRDLTQRVGATGVGQTARVEVLRGGARRTLDAAPGRTPVRADAGQRNPTPNATPASQRARRRRRTSRTWPFRSRHCAGEDRSRYEPDRQRNRSGDHQCRAHQRRWPKTACAPGDIILQAGGRPVRTPAGPEHRSRCGAPRQPAAAVAIDGTRRPALRRRRSRARAKEGRPCGYCWSRTTTTWPPT